MDKKKSPIKISSKFMGQLQLREAIDKTFGGGEYLGSAIIQFQKVDWLLRINIAVSIVLINPESSESVIRRVVEEEDRFIRLVNYFDLLKPDNGLSQRLLEFNRRRNAIVHRLLYEFESFEDLQEELKKFCEEGFFLFDSLSKFLEPYIQKVEANK
jgi:hypothetical protein